MLGKYAQEDTGDEMPMEEEGAFDEAVEYDEDDEGGEEYEEEMGDEEEDEELF